MLRESESNLKRMPFIRNLLLFGFIILSETLFPGLLVNGQILNPIEANSSPSHINATRGGSVWLHWNYSYAGDGTHGGVTKSIYREQVIGFNGTFQPIPQPLARRLGENGTLGLDSPAPFPFTGRVEVISSNNTIAIHRLQFNDSTYQLMSHILLDVDVGFGPTPNEAELKPIITFSIQGIPDFISQPPNSLNVNESSNFQLRIEMDGNPTPSADFRWPHLIGSSSNNASSVYLYPFFYSSTYTLNNINASYCGRILQTTLRNSIGSSSVTASTNVTVLLKLDMDFGLKAGKTAESKCVEVKWNKAESGACYVKYEVTLRNALGSDLCSETGYNIGEMMICNLPSGNNITYAQLTVSFNATSTNVTANVSEALVKPLASTKSGSGSSIGLIVGASVGGAAFLIIVIIFVVWFTTKPTRRSRYIDSGNENPLQDNNYTTAGKVNLKQPPDPEFAQTNRL